MSNLIYLKDICDDDPFWNSTLSFSSQWPAFTECFVYTALSWSACFLYLILLPSRLLSLISKTQGLIRVGSRRSHLIAAKYIGIVMAALFTCFQLVKSLTAEHNQRSSQILLPFSYGLRLFTFICVLVQLVFEGLKQVGSSLLLFMFWSVLAITEMFTLYEKIAFENFDTGKTDLAISSIIYALVIMEFVLSFLSDVKAESVKGKVRKPWPEQLASAPSKLTFTWLLSTVCTAWRRTLTDEDIHDLPESLKSSNLAPNFNKTWTRYCKLHSSQVQETSGCLTALQKAKEYLKSSGSLKTSIVTNGSRYKTFDTIPLANGFESHKEEASEINRYLPLDKLALNGLGGIHSDADPRYGNHGPKEFSKQKESEGPSCGNHEPRSSDKPEESKKLPYTLCKVLLRLNGVEYIWAHLLKGLSECMMLLQPVIISEIIRSVQKSDDKRPLWIGILLSLCLLICSVLRTYLNAYTNYMGCTLGMKIKSQIVTAIFHKSLRISNDARKQYSTGEIITLMSVDAERFPIALRHFTHLARIYVMIVGSALLLYYTVGVASFSGIALSLFLAPINIFVVSRLKALEIVNMRLKSKRAKLTTDVFNGIKVLKLYAWEKSYEEQILEIRTQEIVNMKKMFRYRATLDVVSYTFPFLASFLTFMTLMLISEELYLDPAVAFVCTTYFSMLKTPLSVIANIFKTITTMWISLKRVNRFLYCDVIDEEIVGLEPKEGFAVSLRDATFSWEKDSNPVMSNVTLHIPERSLTIIVGKVGCGKSALLSGILGDIKLLTGSVDVKASTAYIAQTAWIQNNSVKENILFGSLLDQAKYKTVVEACALDRDIKMFAKEDDTEIGERGINLSGGQKQRVALARAVYSDRDIYILDDPLSAVDAHVGRHIFFNVLGSEGLLKDKTRILVTHGIHWLQYADLVVVLENGTVSFRGSYAECLEQSNDVVQWLKHLDLQEEENESIQNQATRLVEEEKSERYDVLLSGHCSQEDGFIDTPLINLHEDDDQSNLLTLKSFGEKEENFKGKIIKPELMQDGKVKWRISYTYFKAGGLMIFVACYTALVLYQASYSGAGFWLRFWTEDPYLTNLSLTRTSEYKDKTNFYLFMYAAFGVGQFFFLTCGQLLMYTGIARASNNLHKGMLSSVLGSPMNFFDSTPIGRLLNRFTGDIAVIDDNISMPMSDCLKAINQIVATFLVISLNVPLFATIIPPLAILFFGMVNLNMPSARQLKRMDSAARSPVFSHFSEALSGASTIRAFGYRQRFQWESKQKLDFNQACSLTYLAWTCLVTLLVEAIGVITVFAAAIFAVTSPNVSASQTGLSVSYSVECTVALAFLARQLVEAFGAFVAIERIVEYSELKSEDQNNSKPIPPSWPSLGQIEFKNFSLRYHEDLDPVLKNISVTIQSGEKVGIVGRTGAGKSTMVMALFRIIEASDGYIQIDNFNIADADLVELRSKLSILPQDPVLFSGFLRTNLDPHNEYSDEEVFRALDRAHLKDFITAAEGGLYFEVGEEGKNMSVGQRQLVCLARALLRQNKILVLDEATAAVDLQTDQLIQETIRNEFKDCTIISIAHRINTIMDYDKVLVLDAGKVKEFASVNDLLSSKDSLFYTLASEAGLV